MFEVIFSQVKTGKVERRRFETFEAAEACRAQWETRLLTPPRPNQRPKSLADFRFEVRRVAEPVAAGPVAAPRRAA